MALGKEAIFEIEKRLWATADELRANSNLKSSEYSVPVLGLIFLRYADHRFAAAQAEIEGKATGRRKISKTDYQARGVLFLPAAARFSALIALPEAANVGKAVNEAMKAIEAENEELRGVLPTNYHQLENRTLSTLLKTFNSIASDDTGDTFGRIYEYFLGEFAMTEGQKGGEFFTPTCLDKLIANIIQPYRGRVIDRACGSGGMFVEAARFARLHAKSAKDTVSVYGIERVAETVRLCRMNLAVHGLAGEVRQGNSYYENPFDEVAAFDFVMANPPFNVDKVDKERLKDDKARFPFGMPKTDNANYLWIQLFYSDLNAKGRAGFVMANSASDARASELEIRRQIIEDKAVDVMVAIGPNMFYTVTLPATLWFFDKGKRASKRGDSVLFVDARHIFRQIDRAHRDITPEQIDFIANIVRLYRDENVETTEGSAELIKKHFPKGTYQDVPGLCKVATIKEIEAQGWSLNAGRYVGVAPGEHVSDEDFKEQLEELNEELEALNAQARELEAAIAKNVAEILES